MRQFDSLSSRTYLSSPTFWGYAHWYWLHSPHQQSAASLSRGMTITRVTSSSNERPEGECEPSREDRSVAEVEAAPLLPPLPRAVAGVCACDVEGAVEEVGTHTSVQDPMQRAKGMVPGRGRSQVRSGGVAATTSLKLTRGKTRMKLTCEEKP